MIKPDPLCRARMLPRYQSGRWYTVPTAISVASPSGFEIFSDLIVGIPIFIAWPQRFNGLGYHVQSADTSGGQGNAGVYTSGPDGLPDELIVQTPDLDHTSTGEKMSSIDIALSPGWYYLAIHPTVATSCTLTGTNVQYFLDYFGSTVINGSGSNWLSRAVTWTGTMPDPFGSPSFQVGVGDSNAVKIPRIALRAA